VTQGGWGSVSFTPVVDAEDTDEIRGFEAEEDPPLTNPQAQFTGTVFEGLHIAVACRGETYQGRIDPCLDDAIQTPQIQLGGGLGIDDFLLTQFRKKRRLVREICG
jgi:hypothetical protein